jgi:hypothetical protein
MTVGVTTLSFGFSLRTRPVGSSSYRQGKLPVNGGCPI